MIWGLRMCILISLMLHYLIHSQITVMGRCICKPLRADMVQYYITRLQVALNTLALKWESHITYWIHKQVGWISQGKTLSKVFLVLYWISTVTSSRALHNSVFCFLEICRFLSYCWKTFFSFSPPVLGKVLDFHWGYFRNYCPEVFPFVTGSVFCFKS